jgi:hypothetical protein
VRHLIRTVLDGLRHDAASLRTRLTGRRSEARRRPANADGNLPAFDRSMPGGTATYGPADDEGKDDREA